MRAWSDILCIALAFCKTSPLYASFYFCSILFLPTPQLRNALTFHPLPRVAELG